MLQTWRHKIRQADTAFTRAVICSIVIVLVALGIFMSDLYAPSLPRISQYFHVSPSWVKMSLSIYLMGLTVPQLFFGPLSDSIGRKKVIMPGLVIALLGSVCCMRASSITLLNLGRLLQGLGIGAITASARAVVRDVFETAQLAKVIAIMGFTIAIAPAIAPLIGATLAQHFGWRSVFVLMTVIIVTCVLVVALLLPESNAHIDPRSFRLPVVLKNYRRLLRNRTYCTYLLMSACAFSIIMIYFTISPYLFEHRLHLQPTDYAWVCASMVGVMMVSRLINIRAIKTVAVPRLVALGYTLILGGALLLLLINTCVPLQVWTVVLPMGVILSGISFIFSNAMTAALSECPDIAATGGALYSSIQVWIAACFSFIAAKVSAASVLPLGGLILALATLAMVVLFVRKETTHAS